jgi:hypothetical protein
MTENPKFVDQFNHLVDDRHPEVTLTTHAQILKIQNVDGATLYAILMDRSLIIPFTSSPDTNDEIKNIVSLNNMDLDKKPDEPHAEAACRLLGLHFNGENSGFYSDNSAVSRSNMMILHIYPKGLIATQEDFLQKVSKMLLENGCTTSIEDAP